MAAPELQAAASMLMGLPDAAALLSPGLTLLRVNPAFALMCGLSRRELEARLKSGVSIQSFFRGARGDELRVVEDALRSRRPIRVDEISLENEAGESLRVNMSIIPVLGEGGEVVALVQILRDVGAESQLQIRYQELMAIERSRSQEFERQVQERTRELRAALEEVTRLSRTDELTKVFNRRAFISQAELMLKSSARHQRKVGLLVCDLDHFKRMNDGFGHAAGDAVLAASAQALSGALRETDLLGRFGGEEFVVLLPDLNDNGVIRAAQRCRKAIEGMPISTLAPGREEPQTVSIGAAVFPHHGRDLRELIAAADRALYAAKDLGRNRTELFSPAMLLPSGPAPEVLPVVVVADSAAERRARLAKSLEGGAEIIEAGSRDELLRLFRERSVDVLVVDAAFEGADRAFAGVELMAETVALQPAAIRVLVMQTEDYGLAVRGAQSGLASAFVLRSQVDTELRRTVSDARARHALAHKATLVSATRRAALPPPEVADIDRTVQKQLLRIHYQPIVEVERRDIFAYEALCRPDLQVFRDPSILFDAAARWGKLGDLGRLVRQFICADLERLEPPALMFINLHPMELEEPELIYLERLVRNESARIVFEITERAAIPDFGRFLENVRDLKKLGVRFAVDDLGAGYASLNSLSLLEPDFVKIDSQLIHRMQTGTRQARLVRRMVQLAEDAGARVVAEGVEAPSELDALIDAGVKLVQGYLFAHPAAPFAPLNLKSREG